MANIRREASSFRPTVPHRADGQRHSDYLAHLRFLHERECRWRREGRWNYRPEYEHALAQAIRREEAYAHGSVEH